MPSTLRVELSKLNFDFEQGKCLVQDGDDRRGYKAPREIKKDAPELDVRFQNGGNSNDLPRFIAVDPAGIFMCYRDSKGSGLRRIERDLRTYLKPDGKIPFPT